MAGQPTMRPYDELIAFEQCDDYVAFEQTPVSYEIEEVKNTASGTERFETDVRVSPFIDESDFQVVERRYQEADT